MNGPPTGMGGGMPAGIPHEAPPSPKQAQALLIWTIGGFCIYGWESLVCLPKEYRLIWRRSMNLSSILYVANRYFGLVQFALVVSLATDVWTPSACSRIFLFEPIGALISVVLSQMILGGRVYAVFSRSRPLALILGTILVVECVVGGIAVSNIRHPPAIPTGTPGLPPNFEPPPCGALEGPFKWQVTYWTLPLFYDTLTFLLTAWKAHSFWKEELDTRLFDIIWRDGLLYFLAILTMNVVNVVMFLTAPNGIRTINLSATIILEVILSCRLILNLRGSHDQSAHHTNLLKSNTLKISPNAPKWSSSTGAKRSTSVSDAPEVTLELYRKTTRSAASIFKVSQEGPHAV